MMHLALQYHLYLLILMITTINSIIFIDLFKDYTILLEVEMRKLGKGNKKGQRFKKIGTQEAAEAPGAELNLSNPMP
jgi:hypothetical protein